MPAMQIVLALFSLLLAAFFFAVAIACLRIGGLAGAVILAAVGIHSVVLAVVFFMRAARGRGRDGLGTLDDGDGAKSFRLLRPACPRCGDRTTRFDWTAIGNLWRVPAAVATAMTAYFPLVGIRFRCPKCGQRFVAFFDASTAAGKWR